MRESLCVRAATSQLSLLLPSRNPSSVLNLPVPVIYHCTHPSKLRRLRYARVAVLMCQSLQAYQASLKRAGARCNPKAPQLNEMGMGCIAIGIGLVYWCESHTLRSAVPNAQLRHTLHMPQPGLHYHDPRSAAARCDRCHVHGKLLSDVVNALCDQG